MAFSVRCRDCDKLWTFHDEAVEPLLCDECQAKWDEYKVFADFMGGEFPRVQDPEPEYQDISKRKCIQREFLGGREEINFVTFSKYVVKNPEQSLQLAVQMLSAKEDEFIYNGFIQELERYRVIDTDALKHQSGITP